MHVHWSRHSCMPVVHVHTQHMHECMYTHMHTYICMHKKAAAVDALFTLCQRERQRQRLSLEGAR